MVSALPQRREPCTHLVTSDQTHTWQGSSHRKVGAIDASYSITWVQVGGSCACEVKAWSADQWVEVLSPNPARFQEKHGKWQNMRTTVMDVAYLLGEVVDLRAAGITQEAVECAYVYFGRERVNEQCQRIGRVLTGLGYGESQQSFSYLLHGLSFLFLLQRSPLLEDISENLLEELMKESYPLRRQAMIRIRLALQYLKPLPQRVEREVTDRFGMSPDGMAREWYEWCWAWYERAVDLSPHVRRHYAGDILAIGRWLYEQVPEVRTPEQWTEDLALRFRSDLCSWTYGQYAGEMARQRLEAKGLLGKPLPARGIDLHLVVIRRFLTDLVRRPHAVHGEPARRISLDFVRLSALASKAGGEPRVRQRENLFPLQGKRR